MFLSFVFLTFGEQRSFGQLPFEYFDPDFEGVFKPNPTGVVIVVTKQEVTPELFTSLARIPTLTGVFFHECTGNWSELRALRDSNVRLIGLLRCSGFDNSALKSVCDLPALEELYFRGGQLAVTNDGLREVLRCKNLKKVLLPDDGTSNVIAEIKRKMPTLKVSFWLSSKASE
jgi:hypothetical protein